MRNPAEAAVVSSADGRQRYATALAAGILAYLRHP
jgi:N-acetylmuramoyl-L-alanine amidase